MAAFGLAIDIPANGSFFGVSGKTFEITGKRPK
jgi:hypothetical protein